MTEAASADTQPARSGRAGSLPRTIRVDLRLTVRLALIFVLIAGLLLVSLGIAYFHLETDSDLALMRADNERILTLSDLTLTETIAEVMSDLRFLGHHHELDDFLRRGGPAAAHELGQEYAALATQKRDYDQIRFLGPDGMERVRVDRVPDGARITPEAELQAKGSRYYFQDMTWLNPDQIYVSPLDLNIEQGQIERPLKPVIRFGLAIFDRQGTRRGYVLINFLAEHLLNKIRDIAGADHSLWLLDDQGEWLLGPEADRWSGQLPERRKRGFASVYPKAWAAIRQQVSGTLSVGGTRYQFARVSPLRSLIAMGDRVQLAAPIGLNDYHWLMLIGNSSASMAVTSHRLSGIAFDGGIAVALLVLVASSALAYAIARQRALANALEQAVDNVPVMVSYLDGEQRYRFNNRAYFQAYGITPKELYGKHVREVVGEDGYRQIQPRLDQAMTGQRVEFEIRREVGGRQRDLLTSYVPDMTADGQVLGLFVLISDITELKDSERREKEHLLELAHLSRLASVGEVTAEIAHQINQPLAAIAMFSNAAQRKLGDDQSQVRNWLATINAQAKRASEEIQQLRRFIDPGKTEAVALDLNGPVREVAALLAYESGARQVGLNLELAESLPPVLAVGIMLEQVIFNLARNAIQATVRNLGTGRVTIRTHADTERVWVEVIDDGPGVDQAYSEHLFEPFGARSDQGLGVNLAISRAIVNNYNGDIGYRNRAAGGALFYFFLPRISP